MSWYASPRFRTFAVVAAILFIAAHAVVAIAFRDTDFFWHIGLGNAFLAGEPFTYGGDWYPLSRTMFDAIPALLPYRLSRTLFFVLGVASLGLSVVLWNRMADAGRKLDPSMAFAAAAFSLVFMAPYISRDFQECGLQLLLLGMLSVAGYALWRGNDAGAGAALGAAIAYKFTPIICLPLLVWKGRWRAALWTVAAVAVLNVLPAIYLGVEGTIDAHRRWVDRFQKVSGVQDIAENGVEPPKVQNQSLMAAMARYLQTYPEGHPLRLEHPGFVQFGDLDRGTARVAAKGMLVMLAAFIAWRVRGRWADVADNIAPQWACAVALCALISPMCWRHHLVLVWPAMFLLVHSVLGRAGVTRYWVLLGAIFVCILLPQRELFGRDGVMVVMSYRPDTLAALTCALLSLFLPAAPPAAVEISQPQRQAA